MSRAFLTEGGGWSFCQSRDRDCMFGDGQGGCMLKNCRYDGKPSRKEEDEKKPQ